MGRAPCCSKVGLHRGPWTPREDTLLTKYIEAHGEGHWRSLPKKAGLLRCGKSCRLRWMNYLRPDIKRGNITPDEDDLIIRLHSLLGNRWSLIAGRLPGRTDNEIKNYWNTHLSKRLRNEGTDPNTHKKLSEPIAKENKRRKNQRSKNNNNKKEMVMTKDKNNKTAQHVEPQKPKVHLPKPTRFTSFLSLPRNDSFTSSTTVTTGSSSQDLNGGGGRGGGGGGGGFGVNTWCNNGLVFCVGDEDQDHDPINSSADGGDDDHTLENLYEEYLQALLKTDHHHDHQNQLELESFAESLLI